MQQSKYWHLALRLTLLYALLVALMSIAKPLFMYVQPADVAGAFTWRDVWQVISHGLPHDLATAGYLVAPVWLFVGVAVWTHIKAWRIAFRVYAIIVAATLAMIYVGDACLYSFWHTKLDATVWTYLAQPQGITQSVSMSYALCTVLAMLATAVLLYYALTWTFIPQKKGNIRRSYRSRRPILKIQIAWMVAWVIAGGLMFLGIRGGIGKSTANVGMVYYSSNAFLNHSAVNPAFSLFTSTLKSHDYGKEVRFYGNDERRRIVSMLGYNTESRDVQRLLNTPRPNVLLVLMEGCGGTFVNAVDSLSDANITPNLNRLAAEGVVFSRMYANSFRTDRGTVCTLSGFPSFPDVSVMKLPTVCEKLPSIASSLKREGYSTHFLYGGDINFTNMRGYLQSTGYDRIEGEEAFPTSVRRTHNWGVTDRITFDTLYHRIIRMPKDKPWHMGFLTLASHEPWGVPYNRIPNDQIANAMAYLDDCIGHFIERLRQTAQWKNTLIVFLPDHGIAYPEGLTDDNERKSHIPLIFTGGVVAHPQRIEAICNQTDLVATLLGQMDIPHKEFRFSRDVLSATYTHPSATHTWQEGTYYLDASGITVVNLLTKPASVLREAPHPSQKRLNAAKALLQTAYDHLK